MLFVETVDAPAEAVADSDVLRISIAIDRDTDGISALYSGIRPSDLILTVTRHDDL